MSQEDEWESALEAGVDEVLEVFQNVGIVWVGELLRGFLQRYPLQGKNLVVGFERCALGLSRVHLGCPVKNLLVFATGELIVHPAQIGTESDVEAGFFLNLPLRTLRDALARIALSLGN